MWNENGECVSRWDAGNAVYAVIEWNGMLCTGQYDGIKLWKNFNHCEMMFDDLPVSCLVVFEEILFSSGYDDCIRKLNIKGGLQTFKAHDKPISRLFVSNNKLFSAPSDGKLKQWTRTGDLQQIFEGPTDSVYCITEWNGALLTGGNDELIIQWTGISYYFLFGTEMI